MRSPFAGAISRVRPRNSSPVPLVSRSRFAGMFGAVSGDENLTAKYGEVGTLFAVVSRLATAVAKVEWTLYNTATSGLPEDRTPNITHASVKFWGKPNPHMHRRRFVETVQQHIDLVGEGAPVLSVVKIGNDRVPIEAWPVRPDRIKPVPDPYDFLSGYVYTAADGQKVPLDLDECKRLIMPNPNDPYRGIGPVQAILTDLDSVRYSAEWQRNFFLNSAEPGGVIEVPETLGDREYDRLKAQWDSGHRGVQKAHRVALLEAGAKWNGTTYTQRDMQFAELRGIGRDVIMEAFGFPKPILGIVEDVNRANADAAEYLFSKWLIEERLDRWKDWLNFDILPMYGRTAVGLEWDYCSPVAENTDVRNGAVTANANAADKLIRLGGDPAEVMAYLGMPDIPFDRSAMTSTAIPPGDPQNAGQGSA